MKCPSGETVLLSSDHLLIAGTLNHDFVLVVMLLGVADSINSIGSERACDDHVLFFRRSAACQASSSGTSGL
jgi:hypothetical protein